MPPDGHPPEDAQSFTNIEDFGVWKILLSARAQKDLQSYKKDDAATFEIVMKKIVQLSKGHFSRNNQRSLTAPKMKVPIYRARTTGDKRIIYQIDCISDPGYSYDGGSPYECQAIWIFGIFTLAELQRTQFWDTLSRQFQKRGQDYAERCTIQREPHLGADDDVVPPSLFPPLPELDPDTEELSPSFVSEADVKEIHAMFVLDKFVLMSQPVLNSIQANKEIVYIPPLSAREREIVEHRTSCYVIGRSGTGKTTTMLLKILGIQRAWEQCPDLGPKPRQVFVTQSPVLRKRVEQYFTKLMSSFDTEETHITENKPMQETEQEEQEDELIGQQYSERWKSGLSERFSDLLDEHFPLFITYDQLCSMLENDIGLVGTSSTNPTIPTNRGTTSYAGLTLSSKTTQLAGSRTASSSDYMQQSRTNFVSYGVFLVSYWDHLPQVTTRGLDPSVVFGEFMGVIKGSEDTVGMKSGCLDRESYALLSPRSQATFSGKRDVIYDLFVAYEKLKARRGDYDAADRTHRILEALPHGGPVGQKVDFLYVDEVQDHLLIDTLLLRKICTNQHGLFWAGDTAQTISIGSSFRFADLKAYHHRIEKRLPHEPGLTPIEPRSFELVTNHRSHSGIVNCARSVVNLILRYWPHSIDALRPERATTFGFRPIFVVQKDVDLEKLLFTNGRGEGIDFGEDQCILVRNDVTKEKLEKRFPNLGNNNFMTLHESKGLEFNDVILYNFFEDSPATSNQWRLVLNGVSYEDCPQDAPTFDKTRHASVCVELKFLYVAITRARQTLWIVDNSEAAEPMKIYWSSKDQISIWSSATGMPNIAAESTSEGWAARGKSYFNDERYAQALVAFRRAGRHKEAKICDAYLLKEKAGLITAIVIRSEAFVTAAKAFLACAQNSPSTHVKERRTCYQAAGDCYSDARDLKNAGNCYQSAELYAKAARVYQEGEYFDEMVKIITQHKNAIGDGIYEKMINAARVHYFKRLNTKAALKLFPSVDKALEFLEGSDLDGARIQLLLELGRILEVAVIHAKNGDMLKTAKTLGISTARGVGVVRGIIEYLFTRLRRGFTFGTTPSSTSSTISSLLALVDQLDRSAMMEKELHELAMLRAIRRADLEALCTFAKTFIRVKNDPAALLCLDHIFSFPLRLQHPPLSEVQASLSLYLDYIRLLNQFWRDESFANGSNHQRLFGFRMQGRNHWLVPKHTLLYGKITGRSDSTGQSANEHKCGLQQLRRGITAILESRIQDRTRIQNEACYDVHGFSPCLRLLVQQKCNPPNGICTFKHIKPEQLSVDWYHARLLIILLQFQILESAGLYDYNMAHYWLGILYTTLHPPFQKLGSLAKLAVARIPETSAGLGVVRNWIRRVCDEFNDNSPQEVDRFRQLFVVVCILAFDLGRNDAPQLIPRTAMYKSKQWPISPFRGAGILIVQDLVRFLIAKDHGSLTLGLSYLRGVLSTQLSVDLNVLCDLVERLTGLYIIACKVDPKSRVLHEVALPRSWFINMLPGTNPPKDTSYIPKFASTVTEFMQQINAQVQRYPTATSTTKERFIANGARVTDLTGPLYIARMCLCLCIMGYNIGDENIRKGVLASIQSLRKGEPQLTPVAYQRYADAKNWDDLVHAFTESLEHPSPDEMILLLHQGIPGPHGWWPEHVCPVTYSRLSGVPNHLLSTPPGAVKTSIIHVQQKSHAEGATETRIGESHGEQLQQAPIDASLEGVADNMEVEVDMPEPHREQEFDENQVKAAEAIQGAYRAYHRHLERKRVSAARKIQAAYRCHLKQKTVPRKATKGTRAYYWDLLRERSREMEWCKDSQYYLLFRVPLADILVCLDTVGTFFRSEKKKASKRTIGSRHKDHKESVEAVDRYGNLLKRTFELQQRLSPSSEFHERQSLTDLQHAVQEVETIVESLNTLPGSTKTKNKIKKPWNRGWKWIFEKHESGVGEEGRRTEVHVGP